MLPCLIPTSSSHAVLSCVLQSYILKLNCQSPIVVFLNWIFSLPSYHRFPLLTFLSSLNRVKALIWLIKSQDHNFLPSAPSSPPLSLTHMSACALPSSFQNLFCQPFSEIGREKIQRSFNQITMTPVANLHINNAGSRYCPHCHSNAENTLAQPDWPCVSLVLLLVQPLPKRS